MLSNSRASFGLRGWIILLAVVVAAGLALSLRGWQWGAVKRAVEAKYPRVRLISGGDLQLWQKEDGVEVKRPLLLDVRTEEEFAVSHIEGARRVEPGATVAEAGLADTPRDQPIVTYCAIGFRSAALAEHLQKAGFTEVWNLDGSIFEWVNTGRPVVREGRTVDVVHPYDRKWGRFLLDKHRAP